MKAKYLVTAILFFTCMSGFSQAWVEREYVEVGVTMTIPLDGTIIDYIANYKRVDFFDAHYEYHYIENEFNDLDGFEEEITYDDAREYVWDTNRMGVLKVTNAYQGNSIYFDLHAWRFYNIPFANNDTTINRNDNN